MGVRVQVQIARPGVQDRGHAKLRGLAEPSRVAPERQQRLGGALEQQVEDEGAVALGQLVQLAGQSEDDVEVVHRQDAIEPLLHPARSAQRLALGAVAVTTGIVGGPLEAA
jgi:hypothetical protein